MAGLLDTGYLTIIKLTKAPLYCTPGLGDCEAVNSSRYSVILGIPVAYIGLAAYLAILFLLVFGDKIKFLAPFTHYLLFGIGLIGFLCSIYFTYLEIWVIKAVCQWCVISAIFMTVIFVSSLVFLLNRQES